jgi:hypothetical protein
LEQRGLWKILMVMAVLLVKMVGIKSCVHSIQRTTQGK